MFYSDEPIFESGDGIPDAKFFSSGSGGGAEEYFAGTANIGRDGDYSRNGGTIESRNGDAESAVTQSGKEEEENKILVSDTVDTGTLSDIFYEALDDAIVRLAQDDLVTEQAEEDGIDENITDSVSESSNGESVSQNDKSTLHDIDDIYELLSSIENESVLYHAEQASYQKGQDVIGRVEVGLMGMILGGMIIYAFIGRVR